MEIQNFHTRYGYTGRERDEQTGLNYYRARWQDPQQGRFISQDPIGFNSGTANFYEYVGNNPILFNDPSGEILPLLAVIAIGAVVGAVVGAGSVIVTKGIGNVYNGKNFFHCATTRGYLTDVALGAAGGAVLGAALPVISVAGGGFIATAGAAAVISGGQYGASVGLGRTQYSNSGLGISLASGAVGGLVGGAFKYSPPNSAILSNAADRALIDAAAREAALSKGAASSVATGNLFRSGAGSLTGNSGGSLDSCECQ